MIDRKRLRSRGRLNWFLNYVLSLIKFHLNINPIINSLEESKISGLSVLITGGDFHEGKYIRNICSKYFTNKIDHNREYFAYPELFYLFKTLQNKMIIFQPVFQMLYYQIERNREVSLI